ncbi:glyceraldehyde-3-phosphate dehydrogenase [Microbacterium sp. JB110]|uniref:glyceraldehyde-3-phosphate dehydrogenase n=2 Tax=unclassified Microbacterium TaxID=2609290 RepID=UPI00097F4326|nr:glyceraldehyde-3-phosphate dehydrogenase [Microbacterium sp. JB110]RCS60395.1 glyceraldehyde-3-phosphate dehydrogenase [Microbacterium sp. JB110]SJM49430.1 NADPH-dependent glyceraldehyde-3-phosphate dehydrogenase [Frigoribacterium sp. JB110]
MNAYEDEQHAWAAREELAERMIPVIGRLYRANGTVVSIHGRRLIGCSPIDILKAHRFARLAGDDVLDPAKTLAVLESLDALGLGAASIDVARLVQRFDAGSGSYEPRALADFLRAELAEVVGAEPPGPTDVVLYGFGRIGRLVARILIAHAGRGSGLRLRAIVVRSGGDKDLRKRASLLRRDSVHGSFDGSIEVDEKNQTILANGTLIRVIYSDDPAAIDYTEYGIDGAIVVDNTGRWRDEEGLGRHLRARGVARVLLTAPGRGSIRNIVHGINSDGIEKGDRILSAASCTTNAITPVLAALDEEYGVERGHVETVHSFTNDQNLIDNFHSGDRRGRAATLNMVITETGAAKAVAKALPQLAGRLTGSAIRVPTPDVSLAILNLKLDRAASKAEINAFLRRTSLTSKLRQQIDYIESPEVVSTDFVGNNRAGIVDGLATLADGDENVVLYVWYDNEFGYSNQVVRVVEKMAGAHPIQLPERDAVAHEEVPVAQTV